MRTMLWCSILSAALAAGACKKSQDDTGKAAKEVQKTQENVNDQAKDLDKVQADRNATHNDLDKAEGDLAQAKADFTAAREKYSITVKDRLAKIDIRMKELEARTDAKAKDALVKLRDERTALAQKIDMMKDRTADTWNDFTKDVDKSFDKIEDDLKDALK